MNILEIYVLAHNRPEYLKETINSILHQDSREFDLIVSDNSTNNDVELMIKKNFLNKVIYRKRFPPLPPIEHIQLVLKELNKKYSVIFHDDDLMDPCYVSEMLNVMEENHKYIAACPNALILRNNQITNQKFFPNAKPLTIIEGAYKVAKNYLDLSKFRMPFPGYMYRTEEIRKITIDKRDGGKHCDVSFLMKIGSIGKIAWLDRSLMSYRIHEKNDSFKEDVYARLSLLRFIYRNTTIKKIDPDVTLYRMGYWSLWLMDKKTKSTSYRRKVVLRFLIYRIPIFCICHPIKAINLINNRFYYIK